MLAASAGGGVIRDKNKWCDREIAHEIPGWLGHRQGLLVGAHNDLYIVFVKDMPRI